MATALRRTAPRADQRLDEVEAIARIGSYSLDIGSGRWVSSPGLDAIFGIEPAFDRSVKGWASLVHPDDREAMLAYFAGNVLARGQPFDREYRVVRMDTGEARWVHGHGRLEFDASGRRPIRMLGTIADITEQRQAQAALADSEVRYAAIFDGALEAILIAERTTRRFRYVNAAASAFFGYTEAEFLELPAWDLFRADDLSTALAQLDTLLSSGGVARSVPSVRKDGSLILADIQASVRVIDGVPCLVGFFTDVTERARAEQDLRESEARYRTLVEHSADGIFVSDATGRYVEANPAICRMLGYSRDELLAMYTPSLRAADNPLTPEEMDERLAETEAGSGLVVERRYRRKDGTTLPAEVSFTVLPDGSLLRTIRDITLRKREELQMRRLATAVEQSADAIVITDAEARIEYVNPAFQQVSGYTSEEVLGQNPRILKSGVQGPSFYDAMWATLTSGESFVAEMTNRRKDGTLYREDAVVSPIRDPDGTVTSYVAVKRDVTELEQIRRERERLAGAVDQAADGIALIDVTGVVTYVNPALVRAFGGPLEEITGQSGEAVAAELLGPAWRATIGQAAAGGRPWIREVERPRADGIAQRLEVSVTPAHNGGGAPTGLVVITRDVTELRKAQAEIALEESIRLALAETLHVIPAEASVEDAAQAICDRLVTLAFVDLAAIHLFLGPSRVRMVGLAAPSDLTIAVGDELLPARAAIVRERALTGPWAEYVTASPAEGWLPTPVAGGIKAMAYGPIVHANEAVGELVIGTVNEHMAQTLVEKMPGIVSFSATSSALLAERMLAMRIAAELQASVAAVLAERAFHPVFQPIVDLASSETVGFEALTRFDSGRRPDLVFGDAWSVGLGADLEIATLKAAVDAAKGLRPGLWLDLNVSPRLLVDPERLRTVLWSADRPIVVEITEHEVIDDYEMVREAVRQLGHDVRLAVDDAGSGVANFGHIIDLRPDFVKLDISLVRRVNANLGRQALVIGMRWFSRTAGCRLIAEGIETPEEARTLTALGVEFGQGYLYGHPEPVAAWMGADW